MPATQVESHKVWLETVQVASNETTKQIPIIALKPKFGHPSLHQFLLNTSMVEAQSDEVDNVGPIEPFLLSSGIKQENLDTVLLPSACLIPCLESHTTMSKKTNLD